MTACAAAHNSGDFVYEDGKIGVAVETNLSGAPNTLVTSRRVRCVVASGVTEGQLLYVPTADLTAGALLANAPIHGSVVTSAIQVTSSSATAIGRAVRAAYVYGSNYVTDIELADPT